MGESQGAGSLGTWYRTCVLWYSCRYAVLRGPIIEMSVLEVRRCLLYVVDGRLLYMRTA